MRSELSLNIIMRLRTELKELIKFLRNPSATTVLEQKDTLNILRTLLILLITQFVFMVIIMTIILMMSDVSTSVISDIKDQNSGVRSFLLIVVFVPIVEELIFRLPLLFRPVFISISFSMLAFFICGHISTEIFNSENGIYWQTLTAILFAYFIYNYCTRNKESIQCFYSKKIKILVWFSILLFALFHVVNFGISNKSILLAPLLTLPQLVNGSILTYARLKYGFIYAIGYHSFNNLIVYLI